MASDDLDVVAAVQSVPEDERHEMVAAAVNDSVKSLRKFAMWCMGAVVVIVIVGMILLVHSQSSDHGTTQHALGAITSTLTQDKQAIINSCEAAVKHVGTQVKNLGHPAQAIKHAKAKG